MSLAVLERKQCARNLALAGNGPAFAAPLHVGRPNVGDRSALHRRIDAALDRVWLTNNGPLVQEFEGRLKELTGVRHCIPVCNATVGLEIAIRALDLSGEVIVPSFTFIATAHALQWQRIKPVFCDIAPNSHHIDPSSVEKLITPRTTAILGVHLWGQACEVEALGAIARRHRLEVLYDAAHALGCSYGGRMIGTFGRAEVFSFHATKFVNTFEGGAIATAHGELRFRGLGPGRVYRHQWQNERDFGRHGPDGVGLHGILHVGELPELQALSWMLVRLARRNSARARFVGKEQLPVHRPRNRRTGSWNPSR